MAIYDFDRALGTIEILFMVKGRGTQILAEAKPGESLQVVAPLGNGFSIHEADEKVLCIAGGVGMAPIYSLIKALHEKGKKQQIIIGARTEEMLLGLDKLQELGVDAEFYTDDGSCGNLGFATEGLEKALQKEAQNKKIDRIYCCGSIIMMEKVAAIAAKYAVPCQVSLEERMGCGVGICMGCVCKHKNEDGSQGLARVCYEGPVFDAKEVIWHD